MPSFENPLPYSPDRTNIWPESFYRLRVDGLPALTNSTSLINFTANFHATLPTRPHTHVRIVCFNQSNWLTGAQSGYFSDRLPAGTSVAFNSPARRTWLANSPSQQPAGKHLYFSDLRQEGAARVFGQYTILSVITQGDKHSVMWSPDSRELVETILYRGDRPESSHATTYILDDYEMPLGANLTTKAGSNASRIPVAPLHFTYADLVACGTTGDLGHMLGFTMEDGKTGPVWPARASDYTLAEGMQEGMILRLKASFDENTLPTAATRALARTLKKHGAVIFDRSPVMGITTPNDPTWPDAIDNDWGTKVQITDFEVVDTSSVATASWTRRYPLEPPAGTFRVGVSNQDNTAKHETPTGKPLGLIRKTYTWANRLNCIADIETASLNSRAIHLSFGTPVWAAVAAGNHDAELNDLFTQIRDTSTCVWVSFAAEPEGITGQGTSTDWRNMQARIAARRTSSGAVNACVVPVLKASTVASSAASTWVIENTTTFPIYGLDFYSTGYSTSPTNLRANTTFQTAVDYLTSRNIDICFPEVGCYEATPTTTLPELDRTGATVPTSNYPAPTGAVYVDPVNGLDTRTLTQAQNPATPLRTVFGTTGAYSKVPAGGTIVCRGGVYEEGWVGASTPITYATKRCTIQAYPGEQVWFDGSVEVTGWTGSGPYTKTGWTFNPGNTSGFDGDSSVGDKPATTYYLDQLFIDGVPQTQVTGTPGAGQFAVNHSTDTVTIGTNPAGKEVRMSRYRCLAVFATRVDLKGIGVRRYAGGVDDATNTSINEAFPSAYAGYAAVTWDGTSEDTFVENCAFVDIARLGLSVTRNGMTINRCVFVRSGQTHLNVGGNTGDRFTFTNNVCIDNNLGGFPREPGAAAIKIVKSASSTVTDNYIEGTYGCYGIWFDQHCARATVARNMIVGGSTAYCAFLFELSGGGTFNNTQHWSYFAGNSIEGSWQWGLRIFDSDYIKVWNNTIEACRDGHVSVLQDNRPLAGWMTSTYSSVTKVDMICSNIELVNNNFVGTAGASQLYAYNGLLDHPPVADDFFSRVEGNWFDSTGNSRAAWWCETRGNLTSYPRVMASEAAPTLDSRAKFTANGWTNFRSATQPADTARESIPSDVAALLVAPTTPTTPTSLPEIEPLFLEAFLTECQDPANRIKGFCWSDSGFNELGVAPSDSDSQALAVLHTALGATYSYRGGAWRGNPTGVIDSIRVTDTTPDVVVPPTDSQTIRRKVEGVWDIYRLRRKTNGVWVDQVVKRISE